jgi:antitoxin (DNA-binding transcriptional repressor) of toxin-antitoxin stability system
MSSTGIRNLKNHLSRYIASVAAGERVVITDRGRPVAEPVPPSSGFAYRTRYEELRAAGVIRPARRPGERFHDWPAIKLPRGTAARLIDEDRAERDER